ncbi:MAG TPA: hypothetical protein V6C88_16040 [Chroococcidiopsis sp.]
MSVVLEPCEQHDVQRDVQTANALADLRFRFLQLTSQVLPELARNRNFPVQQYRGFQRIILDNLLGCCWGEILDSQQAPHRQLHEAQLRGAIAIAEAIIIRPDRYTHDLNLNSLKMRSQQP